MVRRLLLSAGAVLAFALAARCNNDNNTITGPQPVATVTPGGPTVTPIARTATPAMSPTPGTQPTLTPQPSGNRTVNVGQSGGNTFVDQTSGSNQTTITAGATVTWTWVSGTHSVTSGGCVFGCQPDGQFDSGIGTGMTFSHTFNQAGTFPYYCQVHGAMMQGTVVVQ